MTAYYNEIDPYAAEWLRVLIAAGEIAPGDVDERSIEEVSGDDLRGYVQCHFFAGIGGWSCALRLAGWPDERPVWTGSVPCQPFSVAGKGAGTDDPRHLWPEIYRLIRQRLPEHVIGEQVPGAIGHGWLDGVSADLEKEGYAVGSIVLGAHSVGAPHIRQRLWWVAYSQCPERRALDQPRRDAGFDGLPQGQEGSSRIGSGGEDGWLDDTAESRRSGPLRTERCEQGAGSEGRFRQLGSPSGNGFWDAASWIPCGDGKARRVEPGIQPLAYGATARVGRLRAYGNAIVPQVAAEFIRAFEKVRPSNRG